MILIQLPSVGLAPQGLRSRKIRPLLARRTVFRILKAQRLGCDATRACRADDSNTFVFSRGSLYQYNHASSHDSGLKRRNVPWKGATGSARSELQTDYDSFLLAGRQFIYSKPNGVQMDVARPSTCSAMIRAPEYDEDTTCGYGIGSARFGFQKHQGPFSLAGRRFIYSKPYDIAGHLEHVGLMLTTHRSRDDTFRTLTSLTGWRYIVFGVPGPVVVELVSRMLPCHEDVY